ncbi:hypothetical protein O181_030532 [Austropuccinia psidii MF-1]|uniref:Uncharacterized protein n=1 Tax=Austropuccinia psidii MF-1 TaxID=1389203 RepID=A0A9Q3CYV0_9BASI|nr:hypothetical protein [Austropuccinia psidii MF-1]
MPVSLVIESNPWSFVFRNENEVINLNDKLMSGLNCQPILINRKNDDDDQLRPNCNRQACTARKRPIMNGAINGDINQMAEECASDYYRTASRPCRG